MRVNSVGFAVALLMMAGPAPQAQPHVSPHLRVQVSPHFSPPFSKVQVPRPPGGTDRLGPRTAGSN